MNTEFEQPRREGAESEFIEKDDARNSAFVRHFGGHDAAGFGGVIMGQNFIHTQVCVFNATIFLQKNGNINRVLREYSSPVARGLVFLANPNLRPVAQEQFVVILTQAEGNNSIPFKQYIVKVRRVGFVVFVNLLKVVFGAGFRFVGDSHEGRMA